MLCYCIIRTDPEAIIRYGFVPGDNVLPTETELGEVRLLDRAPVIGQQYYERGMSIVCLDIPEAELLPYELQWDDGNGSGFREFFVPVTLANMFGPATIYVDPDE